MTDVDLEDEDQAVTDVNDSVEDAEAGSLQFSEVLSDISAGSPEDGTRTVVNADLYEE
jgi:hypothetical protein